MNNIENDVKLSEIEATTAMTLLESDEMTDKNLPTPPKLNDAEELSHLILDSFNYSSEDETEYQ